MPRQKQVNILIEYAMNLKKSIEISLQKTSTLNMIAHFPNQSL